MEVAQATRPKLVTFRAIRFHGENVGPADNSQPWALEMKQSIEVALGTATTPTERLQALVKIDLDAKATSHDGLAEPAIFSGTYEAKYDFPLDLKEEQVSPLFAQPSFQYMLVSQAFPLAMTLFRRELQTLGFDARELPLGI